MKLLKIMIQTLIIFGIIFSMFGIFVFNMISNNMYSSVDQELLTSANRYFNIKDQMDFNYVEKQFDNQGIKKETLDRK